MSEWAAAKDPDTGKTYWYNEGTGQASWSDPHWQQAFDDGSSTWYWYHTLTGDSAWETPDGIDEAELAALGLAPGVAAQRARSNSVFDAPPQEELEKAKQELHAKYAATYLKPQFLRTNIPLLADMTPDEAASISKLFKLKTITPETKLFEEVGAPDCGGALQVHCKPQLSLRHALHWVASSRA